MQPTITLAERLANLAIAVVHGLIEDRAAFSSCFVVVFASASFPLHLPSARTPLHSLQMEVQSS